MATSKRLLLAKAATSKAAAWRTRASSKMAAVPQAEVARSRGRESVPCRGHGCCWGTCYMFAYVPSSMGHLMAGVCFFRQPFSWLQRETEREKLIPRFIRPDGKYNFRICVFSAEVKEAGTGRKGFNMLRREQGKSRIVGFAQDFVEAVAMSLKVVQVRVACIPRARQIAIASNLANST